MMAARTFILLSLYFYLQESLLPNSFFSVIALKVTYLFQVSSKSTENLVLHLWHVNVISTKNFFAVILNLLLLVATNVKAHLPLCA